jgi:hypothetical protein
MQILAHLPVYCSKVGATKEKNKQVFMMRVPEAVIETQDLKHLKSLMTSQKDAKEWCVAESINFFCWHWSSLSPLVRFSRFAIKRVQSSTIAGKSRIMSILWRWVWPFHSRVSRDSHAW